MKIGTIFINHYAGNKNPVRYFIYMGTTGKYVNGIYLNNGKLQKIQYYRDDFETDMFEKVGYCNAFDVMKGDLSGLVN